jgi:signal peptidase I
VSESIGPDTAADTTPPAGRPSARRGSHRFRRGDDSSRDDGARGSGRSKGSFWKELPVLVVIAVVLALLIKTFLVQAFYIPSASMENTLQGGNPDNAGSSHDHPFDRVLVSKLSYDFHDPHRGDIVVFKRPPGWPDESAFTTPSNPVLRFFHDIASAIGVAPSGSSDFIKRVIGVGGDTVSCRNDVLSVNGHVLNEPFLFPGSKPCSSDNFEGKTVHVAKGNLFVMGDHRDDSDDSRSNGQVPVHDVIGRAFVVIWPIRDWSGLGVPSTFKQAGLAAGTSPVTPLVGGVLLVAPIGVVRRRRRRASYAAEDG